MDLTMDMVMDMDEVTGKEIITTIIRKINKWQKNGILRLNQKTVYSNLT